MDTMTDRWNKRVGHKLYKADRLAVIVFAVGAVLMGCAGMNKKFTATKKVNLAPFADYTISMLAEADYGFTKDEVYYTRDYLSGQSELEKEYLELTGRVEWVGARILNYSIGLVTLSESGISETEMVAKYLKYIKSFEEIVVQNTDLSQEDFNEILENISKQQKLLPAVNAAQPLVNAGSRYVQLVLTKMNEKAYELGIAVQDEIDAEFAPLLNFQATLKEQSDAILDAFVWLHAYEMGDKSALAELRNSPAIRNKQLVSKASLSKKDIVAVEGYLLDQLQYRRSIEWQLVEELELYYKTHEELDKLYDVELVKLSKVHIAMILWARAHQKMASGVTNPAEWFDIKDAPAMLIKAGTKLL